MATQDEFNKHVEKINSLKGRAVEIRGNKLYWRGLTREGGAELKRLEATLPDLFEEDREQLSRVIKEGGTVTEQEKEVVEKDAGLTPSEMELVKAWRKNNQDRQVYFENRVEKAIGEDVYNYFFKPIKREGADPKAMSDLAQAQFCKRVGINDLETARELVAKTALSIVSNPNKDMTQQEISKAMFMVMTLLKEMNPQDPFEAMLACRMIALHYMGMNELGKVALCLSMDGANQFTSRANKLFKLWNEAKDRLDKHRRKEDQKVVVEHVHVNEGGQAIVGNVTHPGN